MDNDISDYRVASLLKVCIMFHMRKWQNKGRAVDKWWKWILGEKKSLWYDAVLIMICCDTFAELKPHWTFMWAYESLYKHDGFTF